MNDNDFKEIYFQGLVAFFAVIVVVSNILSAKMATIPLVGIIIPAGLITYPFTFLISDLVTEIFGPKRARCMIYLTLLASLLSFLMIGIALLLPSEQSIENNAFQMTLGLSGLRIFSSMFAFVVAQVIDVQLYALIRKLTRGRKLWLRSNGSTIFSQLIDTILIDIIFLYWGLGMDLNLVIAAMLISMIYKSACSIAVTPLFYIFVLALKEQKTKPPRGKIEEFVL